MVILGAAAADFAHVESQVNPVPPADCGTNDACNDARNAELEDRLAEAIRLDQQYESRAWLYAAAIIAAIAAATAVALRTRRKLDWARVFTNLGIAGVWAGIAATVAVVLNENNLIEVPATPAYAPAVAMIGAAALGTLIGRAQGWGETDPLTEARAGAKAGAAAVGKATIGEFLAGPRRESAARFFTRWALGLTAVTVVLAVIFIQPQPDCGGSGNETVPTWTDTISALAAISAIAAISAGVGALILRRWLPALLSLFLNPFALLFMAASTCAFY